MGTTEDLQSAFAGESQANRKYLAFAQKAEKDGFKQVARLFRAVAEAETIHAHAHLRVMKGVKDTADNLRAAIEGETYEFTQMYPAFIAGAEAEGNKAAHVSFSYANEVEKIHGNLFTRALESVEGGTDLPVADLWICSVCGHTVEGDAPDKCPICKVGKDKYYRVD
jgi:rubrerythrin